MKPGSQETLVDNKVSDLIQNHLPSQLKEGDSLLPKFIEKYYEFAESTIVHYDDLKLDEFNIVQEDGGQAYQLYGTHIAMGCLLYTSPSPRDVEESRMPSSA